MSFDSCLIAVRLAPGSDPGRCAERVATLVRYYSALEAREPRVEWLAQLRVLLAEIAFARPVSDAAGVLVWGCPTPTRPEPAFVLDAPDRRLRSLDGVGALIAFEPSRARIVSSAGGVTALYECQGREAVAWSTHAVAAAWVATGDAQVEETCLPELVATDFLGGDRSLIRGVRAIDTATCIDLDPDGWTPRSFYPARERWSLVPEAEAYAEARDALLGHLGRHCRGRGVLCGVTAGLDSPVTAVALRRAGIDFAGLTVGAPGDPDVVGGRELAASLGVEHRVSEPEHVDASELASQAERQVLWTEGLAPLSFHRTARDPADVDLFVTGGGGEAGRAFYYGLVARSHASPRADRLRRLLRLDARLRGASPEASRLLSEAIDGWIDAAEDTGLAGWRLLDVVFVEQRLRRLTRGLLRMGRLDLLLSFGNPGILRALASLPLEDRLRAGFHREFLREARAGPCLPPPGGQRRGVPRPVRRVASVGRAWASRLRRESAASDSPPGLSDVCAWVAGDPLQDALLRDVFGGRWTEALASDVRTASERALEVGLLGAAPVVLSRTLRHLRARSDR